MSLLNHCLNIVSGGVLNLRGMLILYGIPAIIHIYIYTYIYMIYIYIVIIKLLILISGDILTRDIVGSLMGSCGSQGHGVGSPG
jgi:hypothetical protein